MPGLIDSSGSDMAFSSRIASMISSARKPPSRDLPRWEASDGSERAEKEEAARTATAKFLLSTASTAVLEWEEFLFGLPDSEWMMAAAMMKVGHFEQGLVRFLERACGPDSGYVEVGASYGTVFLPAVRRIRPGGWAEAWEPEPLSRDYLIKNAHLNGHEESSWLRVIAAAAGKTEGERTLCVSRKTRTHSSFWLDGEQTLERMEVLVRRLDKVYQRPIDVLKIDAEGAEWDVLEGARGLLDAGLIRGAVVEFGPSNLLRAGMAPGDFLSALEGLGGKMAFIHRLEGALEKYDRGRALECYSANLFIDFS